MVIGEMTKKEANRITGGLSNPEKMPEGAWSISALLCNVGSKLGAITGSVCETCYALQHRYLWHPAQSAMARRLEALQHPQWIPAMIRLIRDQHHFRWFDSGDIQGMDHLLQIIAVAEGTPDTLHWLPTKEYGLVTKYRKTHEFPPNLIVRVSAPMIDGNPVTIADQPVSVVAKNRDYAGDGAYHCPAKSNADKARKLGPNCGECRNCWNPSIMMIEYPKH